MNFGWDALDPIYPALISVSNLHALSAVGLVYIVSVECKSKSSYKSECSRDAFMGDLEILMWN